MGIPNLGNLPPEIIEALQGKRDFPALPEQDLGPLTDADLYLFVEWSDAIHVLTAIKISEGAKPDQYWTLIPGLSIGAILVAAKKTGATTQEIGKAVSKVSQAKKRGKQEWLSTRATSSPNS